ncbi:MAG: AI-2E family transporter, partial [Candidatus Nanohaloarchaea archaeon]
MTLEGDRMNHYFFFGLIGVFGILSYLLVAPYLYYMIGAAVLVYVTYPLYRKLEKHIGNEMVASLLAILVLTVLAVLPTIYLADQVVLQGRQALKGVGTEVFDHLDTSAIENTVRRVTGFEVDLDRVVRDAFVRAGNMLSARLPGIITTAFDAMVGMFVMALTMYYLFKEGPKILDELKEIVPLSSEREDTLITELDRMSKAVLYGHVLVSVIQGVIAGIGLWIFGIPNVVFWTFIMIVLGLIP